MEFMTELARFGFQFFHHARSVSDRLTSRLCEKDSRQGLRFTPYETIRAHVAAHRHYL
jgi:hypothetical protein